MQIEANNSNLGFCSRSFMELVNADVESDQLDALTDSMFSQAGFTSKSELTFDDFRAVMAEYKENLDEAQLNLSGWCSWSLNPTVLIF